MKASELRIGNLVDIGEVVNISMHTVNVTRKNWLFTSDYNDIKPIPITEEWILKFGFVKTIGWDDMVFWRQPDFNFNSFEIYETEKGYESPHDKLIEHVHTLQNCYFFHELTGKELKLIP